MSVRILEGDTRDVLRTLPAESVQCVVTSPPYFGLRDYGVAGQIGQEATPQDFVDAMVQVFGSVRRVLRDDGVVWLNLGSSYASKPFASWGIKPKDDLCMPHRVAMALQADGWFLRSAITWCKPAPMPESVTDRPTSATEQVFLLTKRASYFYDSAAIAEPFADERMGSSGAKSLPYSKGSGRQDTLAKDGKAGLGARPSSGMRNARNWWVIPPSGFSGAHFATMPPELAERCIRAGSRPGDTVLDPFSGAGTTALAADRLQRNAIGIELNPEYAAMSRSRITQDAGLFGAVA